MISPSADQSKILTVRLQAQVVRSLAIRYTRLSVANFGRILEDCGFFDRVCWWMWYAGAWKAAHQK
jgi:hypothetical protein